MRWMALCSLAILVGLSTATPGIMKPINVKAFESATGIKKRSDVPGTEFADLDLAKQQQLVYGSEGSNGQMLLANMTLYAPDGLPIVMMERFEGLTKAVDCQGDDGILSVTFIDKRAFEYAINSWSWINEDSDDQFLMIANHDGCGPDEERAAYRITDVENDEKNFITYLTSVEMEWKDITGDFEMDFGKATLTQPGARSLRARDLWDNLKEFGSDVQDELKDGVDTLKETGEDAVDAVKQTGEDVGDFFEKVGDTDLDQGVEFNLQGGTPNERKNIFTDPTVKPPRLTIDCANCFTEGKFKVEGKIRVKGFKAEEVSISGTFVDFKTTTEIDTTINIAWGPTEVNDNSKVQGKKSFFSIDNAKDPVKLEEDVSLIEMPVPGAGIVVPKIFSLGLIGTVDVGFALMFKGAVGFTIGMTTQIPNTATVTLDMANLDSSSATGFDMATMEPTFDLNNASVTMDGSIFFKPKLALKAEITAVGEVSADLGINLPAINANATAEFNEEGVCKDNMSKTGLKFKLGGMLSLVATVSGKLEGISISGFAGRLFQKTLWSFSLFQFEKCFPLPIPGFDSMIQTEEEENQTSIPEIPVSTPIGTGIPPVTSGISTGMIPVPTNGSVAIKSRKLRRTRIKMQ